MASEKQGSRKTETKAGFLGKDSDSSANAEKETTPDKDYETTPKISKQQAEGQHGDKPVH